jgi:hypothetical protein
MEEVEYVVQLRQLTNNRIIEWVGKIRRIVCILLQWRHYPTSFESFRVGTEGKHPLVERAGKICRTTSCTQERPASEVEGVQKS